MGLTPAEEIDFVNREIDRELELWRYADSMMLGPAAPFVGLSAALVPAAVVLSDVVEDSRRFYLACIPAGLFLAALALFLAFRVVGIRMVTHCRQLRVAALRGYFADRSPELAVYLTARVDRSDLDAEIQQMAEHTRARVIVHPLVAGSSALVGTTAGFALWWVAEDAAPWLLTTSAVVATLVALVVELNLLAGRRRAIAAELAAELGLQNPAKM